MTAGRTCPLHYRYAPHSLAREAEHSCEVLYVVGGLYGNEPALEAVLALFERETGPKRLVFNGDFHWFDVDPARFERIQTQVLTFDALRGNVETELFQVDDGEAGCGCAYPEWVGDAVVEHSNHIIQRLRQRAQSWPAGLAQLAELPMTRRVDVGGRRVAIVHGDAESLAGWGFSQERLRDPAHRPPLRQWFEQAQVDIFACSHTCLPVFCRLPTPQRGFAPMVLNNGAAGMPNFWNQREGLLTRIATRPFEGPQRLFGMAQGGLHMDAIAVAFDPATWQRQFLAQWPAGSAAHASYWERITHGPRYELADALITLED